MFPEKQAPYTVREITRKLRECYSLEITENHIYRAITCLEKRPALAEIMKPEDEGRPALYSEKAAQRITRHLTNYIPPMYSPPILLSERARRLISPTSQEVQSKPAQSTTETPIAA